ncbi:MAG: TetR family transcriptional regulator [Deltaproteobacteria bacterium]|nr:TetR family transcriptional regulator [Deltaproteobacteria bacterium]
MAPKRRKTRDELAAESRQKIADAALLLFSERGVSATSTRRVAQAAGVSEGLVFHHFPTKLHLLRGALEGRSYPPTMVARLLGGDAPVDLPIADFLRAATGIFVTYARADRPEPRLFRLLLAEAPTNPIVFEHLKDTERFMVGLVGRYLASRVAAGELRADLAVDSAVRVLMGSFVWFLWTHADLTPDAWDQAATAHARAVTAVWLDGARPRPDADAGPAITPQAPETPGAPRSS